MSISPASLEWVYAERPVRGILILRILAPILTVVIFPVLVVLAGLTPVLGVLGVGAIVAGLVVAEVALGVQMNNQLVAKGIKVGPTGIEVLPRMGKGFLVPWGSATLAEGRAPGFGILRYTAPAQGARVLTPNQYIAVRSAMPAGTAADSHPLS